MTSKQEYIPKKKVGRPTKYNKDYGPKVIDLMEQGKSIVACCKELRISRDTFYRWLKEHDDFRESVQEGLTYSEAWWEELGLAGMLGQIDKFNPTMYIHRVNTQFKWQQESNPGQTVNIENLQINTLSEKELDKQIENLTQKIKLIKND